MISLDICNGNTHDFQLMRADTTHRISITMCNLRPFSFYSSFCFLLLTLLLMLALLSISFTMPHKSRQAKSSQRDNSCSVSGIDLETLANRDLQRALNSYFAGTSQKNLPGTCASFHFERRDGYSTLSRHQARHFVDYDLCGALLIKKMGPSPCICHVVVRYGRLNQHYCRNSKCYEAPYCLHDYRYE